MADPSWTGVGLPASPLLEGNQRQAISFSLVFSPDRGPPISSQGATLPNFIFPWNFVLTPDQRDIFVNLFHVTLKGGTGRFTATDPYEGDECSLKFEGDYLLQRIRSDVYLLQSVVRRVT